METRLDAENVLAIVRKHQNGWGGMISLLTEVQSVYGYLPEEALRIIASATGASLADIYGVATFYRAFSLQPRGKHHVCVCMGTACHVRGAQMVVEEFARRLGINPGETTPDGNYSLETVNCLGACALGPIVRVNADATTKARPGDVKRILNNTKRREEEPALPEANNVCSLENEMEPITT